MCTTMMVLTTIALILRQRFSNKIKPECEKEERDLSASLICNHSCDYFGVCLEQQCVD
uniref:Uncharacterized protein n=1 Tax=Stegastes partitus TaxID=144197 RepID=A0A3B5ANY7_9TELE